MLFTPALADCAIAAGIGAAGSNKATSSASAKGVFREDIMARINASCSLPPMAGNVAQ